MNLCEHIKFLMIHIIELDSMKTDDCRVCTMGIIMILGQVRHLCIICNFLYIVCSLAVHPIDHQDEDADPSQHNGGQHDEVAGG